MFHKWAPGATFWLAKGTVLWNTLADYMRGVLIPAGYVEVKAPIVFNKALWETSGHWQHYRAEHVPGRERRRADGSQGDELPRPLPDLRQRGPQLSRPADPLSRADAAAPQRSVGRADRADARPAVQPGRRPLLRHGVADRRGSRAAAAARAARLRRLRAEAVDEAVDAAGGVPGRDRDVEPRRARAAARRSMRSASPTTSTRATARSTARRSTSTSSMRSAASGSARRSSSTTRCPSAST